MVCRDPSDPAHVKSRGSGGDDVPENLISLCRKHHTEQHTIGWVTFIERYPGVEWLLEEKGWVIEELFGRKRLTRKEGVKWN